MQKGRLLPAWAALVLRTPYPVSYEIKALLIFLRAAVAPAAPENLSFVLKLYDT
jgi:hypothetical protein